MALTKKQIANRKKWVEALRSGKFKQGNGKLKANNKFCCQGVACELFKDEVGGKWTSPTGYLENFYPETEKVKFFTVPESDDYEFSDDATWSGEIAELLGIDEDDANQLIGMNDGIHNSFLVDNYFYNYTLEEPATFEEIADCIEFMTLAGL